MTYTFTLQDTPFTQDETFDRLYADSLDDFESGTVIFRTGISDTNKKARIYTLLTQGGYDNEKLISISKDGTVCMYIQGWIKDNTLVWNGAVTAKINNSKSWCAESQLWTDNKTWTQSKQCNSFEIICIADSRIETFLTGINTAGRMQGTLSKTTNGAGLRVMRWEF